MAAEATARATLDAIMKAQTITTTHGLVPAATHP
jgi:hypothetical protein